MKNYINQKYADKYECVMPLPHASNCFRALTIERHPREVLLKTYDFSDIPKKHILYENEVRLLQLLHDAPYIPTLHETLLDEEKKVGIIVQDYIEHEDLIDMVNQSTTESRASEAYGKEVARMMKCMLDILLDLEERGIVHGDIKPENMLYVPSTQKMWLVDLEFGMVVGVDPPHSLRGTIPYVDYALIVTPAKEREVLYVPQHDLWSTAISFYRMLFVGVPFDVTFDDSILSKSYFRKRLLRWNFVVPLPDLSTLSPIVRGCAELLVLCFTRTIEERPSLKMLKQKLNDFLF